MEKKLDASSNKEQGGVAAVDRAFHILSVFRPGDESLTLAQLAERTSLYKSTILRLLESLERARVIQRAADGRYALGHEIARLHAIYQASYSLERVVMPVLQQLVQKTGESIALHVRRGDLRECYFRVDSPHPVRDHIKAGDLLPLNRGTGGRVLLAYSELDESTCAAERKLYADIRAQGYYAAVGDRLEEVAGISAPVTNANGKVVAALTLTCPAHRYDTRFITAVIHAAGSLHGVMQLQ